MGTKTAVKTVMEMAFSLVSDKGDRSENKWIKWGWTKKDVDPPTGWNSPYCEEVGETGKVRELGWSGREGEGIPSLARHTVFVLYRHYPRMSPADLPSALALPLMAAGVPSPRPSLPRMATMDRRAETLPVSKISSTYHFHGSVLSSPFDLFAIFHPWIWYADACTFIHAHTYSISAGTITNMYAVSVTPYAGRQMREKLFSIYILG